ncbi:RagB/SusD family nutrient uptake outer membrane protein [uncultured Chitinophaga sp.]|uniref:RagB/SusD family nutrient uptake outer membrane protein n=1 Tax=uncultured Chitinophaga sp. TaxID=339340 RepID=UPI0026013350|nr:RagB/SusD family nutrient uptake outer membrane protein [uncultured Chitinophaga sp.]
MKIFSLPAICLVLVATLATGCEKFLGVRPDTNQANLYKVADLQEMLNSSGMGEPNFVIADLVSDDIMIPERLLTELNPNSYFTKAHIWGPTVWEVADVDPVYNSAYKWILQMNIILNYINETNDGTPAQKSLISAQAKINRAYYYYQLLNLYGPAYQAATAATDLAVPLVLAPDASLKPARATVKAVYDQIVKDLEDAVNTSNLPDFGVDVIHPGKAAALAMLAKTYLYAGNYAKAQETAGAALAIRSAILDFNTFSFVNPPTPAAGVINKPMLLRDQTNNPEVLFAKVCIDYTYFSTFKATPLISDDLSTLLGTKDLRFLYNFYKLTTNTRYSYMIYASAGMQFNYSIGVPEMMLIRAECLARDNGGSDAITLLNQLRLKRFKTADYAALTYTNDEDALKAVLDERRRELFMRGGTRTFDLKRLNLETAFKKDLVRKSDVTGNVIATLPAGSPRYLFPFQPSIIANNPLIIPNER